MDDCPDLVVRPDLDVRADLEDKEDTSERSVFDDSSEMEESLVFEVTSDEAEEAVVGLFFSRSCRVFFLLALKKKRE